MSYNEFARVGNEASWRYAFSNRLKHILNERNIKYTHFARQTGIPKSSIDAYLSGSTIPNYYRMMLIAQALDMPIDKLTDLRPFADLDDYEDDELED